MGSSLAIDLSSFNKALHLDDVQLEEVSIICCRATIGTKEDSHFATFATQYLKNESKFFWGAYHVVTGDDPKSQLESYQKVVDKSGAALDLIPILDIETNGLNVQTLRATTDVFEEAYNRLCIYTYQGYITNQRFGGYNHHPLWLAHYPREMPKEVLDNDASTTPIAPIPRAVWKRASLWQLNGNDSPANKFAVKGVDVDLSICYNVLDILVDKWMI
jgi:GH25 family lysozyme M1 (1,4-beta-N-acetylmuramidase)